LFAPGEVGERGSLGGECGVVGHLLSRARSDTFFCILTPRASGQHTLAMNKPKAPPSAKPIVPEMAVLTGQDSIAACICGLY
jgi:hypothetical protein